MRFVLIACPLVLGQSARPQLHRLKSVADEEFGIKGSCDHPVFENLDQAATMQDAQDHFKAACLDLKYSPKVCTTVVSELWQGEELAATFRHAASDRFCERVRILASAAERSALLDETDGEAALEFTVSRKLHGESSSAGESAGVTEDASDIQKQSVWDPCKWRWLVQLKSGQTDTTHCHGVLLESRWILTHASCATVQPAQWAVVDFKTIKIDTDNQHVNEGKKLAMLPLTTEMPLGDCSLTLPIINETFPSPARRYFTKGGFAGPCPGEDGPPSGNDVQPLCWNGPTSTDQLNLNADAYFDGLPDSECSISTARGKRFLCARWSPWSRRGIPESDDCENSIGDGGPLISTQTPGSWSNQWMLEGVTHRGMKCGDNSGLDARFPGTFLRIARPAVHKWITGILSTTLSTTFPGLIWAHPEPDSP